MLVDDLGATSPHKQDRKVIELSNLALQPDPVHKKHRHIKFVVAQMLEEGVLDRCRRLCGHFLSLRRRPKQKPHKRPQQYQHDVRRAN